jgi:hypothetical protein
MSFRQKNGAAAVHNMKREVTCSGVTPWHMVWGIRMLYGKCVCGGGGG